MSKYEIKLSDPNSFQQELDQRLRTARFKKDLEINTIGDLIFYTMCEREATNYVNKNGKAGAVQCSYGRLRSIDDLYILSKTYGFNISLKELKEVVESLYMINQKLRSNSIVRAYLRESYCYIVRKRVHSGIGTKEQINILLTDLNLNYQPRKQAEAVSVD